jgi:hypothetical protein
MTKEELSKQVNAYITQVSNLTPPPLDYIARLQTFKTMVEIATPAELTLLEQQWRQIAYQDKG